MSTPLIKRNDDIVSLGQLKLLFELPNFPAFMGTTTQERDKDILAPMRWYISPDSGMIQLNPVLPLEVVYQTEHNPGTTGASWAKHHQDFARFIAQYGAESVYEIGAAHGILNIEYNKITDVKPRWHVLDPNPIPDPASTATFETGFFDRNTDIPADVDLIVHSHVLEHFYDPEEFFATLTLSIRERTKMCFSVPNLKRHLENPGKFTNILNFEHTYYCSEDYIEYWLSKYGFTVLAKDYFEDDHSIFYAVEKSDFTSNWPLEKHYYKQNQALALDYFDYHKTLVQELHEKIGVDRAFLFGAHVFSQFLLAFGLDESKIRCILDNSPHKQGQRLYGTGLEVKSPELLRGIINPRIILRSGVFDAEIKAGILAINPTAVFL